ncbi:hypothetical protein WMY93_028085 [Mugilogobius chulae]|uniref:Uncharacterized protein n=1 Tax=Mugilogobius chulae TaxID=88201 RepID=A0AAW0MTM2_9GOBI
MTHLTVTCEPRCVQRQWDVINSTRERPLNVIMREDERRENGQLFNCVCFVSRLANFMKSLIAVFSICGQRGVRTWTVYRFSADDTSLRGTASVQSIQMKSAHQCCSVNFDNNSGLSVHYLPPLSHFCSSANTSLPISSSSSSALFTSSAPIMRGVNQAPEVS